MSKTSTIWTYQVKLLTRNRLLMAGLVFLFVAGLYSARYGSYFTNRQEKIIHTVDSLHRVQAERLETSLKEKTQNPSAGSRQPGSYVHVGTQMLYYAPG